MISDPDLVVACPHCQALAKIFTVESADLRGAVTWSDGWQDAPMMPKPPRITRCPAFIVAPCSSSGSHQRPDERLPILAPRGRGQQ